MHIQTSDQAVLRLGIGQYTCNWGAHMCGLYATEQERDEIIFGYLKEGSLAGDKQIFIHSEQSREEFGHNYGAFCPTCLSDPRRAALLDIKTAPELYYPNGVFDPVYMDGAINGYYAATQSDGKNNLRAIAEMAWALQAVPGVEYLFAYESRLNYFVKNRSVVSLCLYNINKISATTMMNVLRTHPFTISGGVINQNPFFVHPDVWLAANAPQFLDANFPR
jgi:hypothetical protein